MPIPRACGGGVRLIDRTNNILQSWFGALTHGERRRSGRKILTRDRQFVRIPALEQRITAAALSR